MAGADEADSRQGEGFYDGQEGGKAMLDGDNYPDYEGAILEEQENEEYYGDI